MMGFVSEHLVEIEGLIGAGLVFYFNCRRFGRPPPHKPLPHAVADLFDQGVPLPVGSNTTRFKFLLNALAFGIIGVCIYGLVYLIPSVAGELKNVLVYFGAPEKAAALITEQGAILKAFLIGLVLPALPPFKELDQEVRNYFYDLALIPAQQRSLAASLKRSPFDVNMESLRTVTRALVTEDFRAEDIVLESRPTNCSLWTKAAVLMHELEKCQATGSPRCKKAFAVLREPSDSTRSFDLLCQRFEELTEKARRCFSGLEDEHTQATIESQFRKECKIFLNEVYSFLSRVALFCHSKSRDRVQRLNGFGFMIEHQVGGPTPDLDDLVVFLPVLALITIFPLSTAVGLAKAIMIFAIYTVCVGVPIALGASRPEFVLARVPYKNVTAAPLLAGILAATLAVAISIGFHSLEVESLTQGAISSFTRSSPWLILVFVMATTITVLMRTGTYPRNWAKLTGWSRIRIYGSARDALVLALVMGGTAVLIVQPLASNLGLAHSVSKLEAGVVPSLIGAIVGFLVPTWFRGQIARLDARRVKAAEERDHARPKTDKPVRADLSSPRPESGKFHALLSRYVYQPSIRADAVEMRAPPEDEKASKVL